MLRNRINYLGFNSLNDIDKNEIKRIYLVSKKIYPNINVLLDEVQNLDDLDYEFNNWLTRKQTEQLRSSKSTAQVLPVMSATAHGVTRRKRRKTRRRRKSTKKRKPRKKKSVKKRKGKSKKKRVRRGRKTKRRS